jgi:hypothetical protein
MHSHSTVPLFRGSAESHDLSLINPSETEKKVCLQTQGQGARMNGAFEISANTGHLNMQKERSCYTLSTQCGSCPQLG